MSQQSLLDALMPTLDEDHALAVIDHRRVTIKKPLTTFAARLLAKRFAAWGDPNEAAEIMIEKCWQGFDPSWVRDRRPGQRTHIDAARDFHGSAGIFGRVGNA